MNIVGDQELTETVSTQLILQRTHYFLDYCEIM